MATHDPLKYIRDNNETIDWITSSMYTQMTEDFIEEFQDKVHWANISYYQNNISEEFIIKFEDKIVWQYISQRRQLSNQFILKYIHKLKPTDLLRSQRNLDKITEEYLKLLIG